MTEHQMNPDCPYCGARISKALDIANKADGVETYYVICDSCRNRIEVTMRLKTIAYFSAIPAPSGNHPVRVAPPPKRLPPTKKEIQEAFQDLELSLLVQQGLDLLEKEKEKEKDE